MPRSIDELIAKADEFADTFEASEPREDDRRELPPLQHVRRAAHAHALTQRELLTAVQRARDTGESWAKIGRELGTSGEAARQRYGNKVAG